jgi:hypothetical protein
MAQQDVDIYCNARYDYCIGYPTFLIPQPEAYNGDGRIFTDKQGRKILVVFGYFNQDLNGRPMTLQQQYSKDIKQLLLSKASISYRKLGNNFYVLSGTQKDKIFYQKTIIKKDAFCSAILEYKAAGKAVYDSVATRIAASFK